MSYVCAFRGVRDSYQVPVALAEGDVLDTLVTDFYCGDIERKLASLLPERLGKIIRSRSHPGLSSALVRRLPSVASAEVLLRFAGTSSSNIYEWYDPKYGEVAASIARRNRSDLYIYSPHAWTAFNAKYHHDPKKILFQYHPHHILESQLLRADSEINTKLGLLFSGTMENINHKRAMARHSADSAWQLADHIVCASEFTKQSLLQVGASPDKITVAPYGVSLDEEFREQRSTPNDSNFKVLFVGSGVQRKGLHHLLRAWSRANLPQNAHLTIVARVVDPGLEPLLASTPRTSLLRGVTNHQLRTLYDDATLFCMPSLVEGFGQVYLEALARGLPILGTHYTCCPDLGTEDDGVFVTNAGNQDELIAKLESLSCILPDSKSIRIKARECAKRFTWGSFRAKIRSTAT